MSMKQTHAQGKSRIPCAPRLQAWNIHMCTLNAFKTCSNTAGIVSQGLNMSKIYAYFQSLKLLDTLS
eukprot:4848814-Amphidinium_carterae.2